MGAQWAGGWFTEKTLATFGNAVKAGGTADTKLEPEDNWDQNDREERSRVAQTQLFKHVI